MPPRTEKLPEGPDWAYELKLDGYRALAYIRNGDVRLISRTDNDLTDRFAAVAAALGKAAKAQDAVIEAVSPQAPAPDAA